MSEVVDEVFDDGAVINELTVPPQAWDKLCRLYREAHSAPFHRGKLIEDFTIYAEGLADGLEMHSQDLIERVREVLN